MGGGKRSESKITWEEVQRHDAVAKEKWLVIDNTVYNVTRWQDSHPGGKQLLENHAGQDATDAFTAFHPDKDVVQKYLKPLCIGQIPREQQEQSAIVRDMRKLRSQAEEMGLFESNLWFYAAHLGHIIALDLLAWVCLWWYGTGWLPYILTVALLSTAQAQAMWLQHDFGHLSVFKKSRWNHWFHQFVFGGIKATSARWWNSYHFRHHAKTNVVEKDPDINILYLFMLGDKIPKIWGKLHKGFMPYNFQSKYFFLIFPPFLIPYLFHYIGVDFMLRRRLWTDIALTVFYFIRLPLMYSPLLGGFGTFKLYMIFRFFESHWFTWTSQMSHIPMDVDNDNNRDWFTSQLLTTCNVDQSAFNDWFTGHLNFQIEHHLFPTMPRHNLWKIAPYVKAMCKKHDIEYKKKHLSTAYADVIRSLKHSGDLWLHAYQEVSG